MELMLFVPNLRSSFEIFLVLFGLNLNERLGFKNRHKFDPLSLKDNLKNT